MKTINKLYLMLILTIFPIITKADITDKVTMGLGDKSYFSGIVDDLVNAFVDRSQSIINILMIIVATFIILDFMFSGLDALIEGRPVNFMSNIANKVITYMVYVYIMLNWTIGLKIFQNLVLKPIFLDIPRFFVSSIPITDSKVIDMLNQNQGLVNLDTMWNMLIWMPGRIFEVGLATIGISAILTAGGSVILIFAIALYLYVIIVGLYLKIVTTIIHMIFIVCFSFLMFPFNFMGKLAMRYGGAMISTYIIIAIQYTMLQIAVLFSFATLRTIQLQVSNHLLLDIISKPIQPLMMGVVVYLVVQFLNKMVDMICNISNNL